MRKHRTATMNHSHTNEARTCKTCWQSSVHQLNVNTLSISMRNPTMIAMRRLKKLTRYLLGTSEVCQKLCLHAHAETLKCLSKAIGLTTKKLVKAAVEEQFSFTDAQCSHGHTQKTRVFFERRDRVVRHSLRSTGVFGNSATFPRKAVQNSTASSDNHS